MKPNQFRLENITSLRKLSPGERIHFIGIGGIGMGQLALALASRGYQVSGSDRQFYPPMSELLQRSPIRLSSGFAGGNITSDLDLVVIGNSVSQINPEVAATAELELPFTCFAPALHDLVIRDRKSLVVTGTHGKTTTTAMLASALSAGARKPSYFIGGVLSDGAAGLKIDDGDWSIIEGDEYHNAFFSHEPKLCQYDAHTCIINGIELDHVDRYESLPALTQVYSDLVGSLPASGAAICNLDCPVTAACVPSWRESANCIVKTFGFHEHAEYGIVSRQAGPTGQSFELRSPDGIRYRISISILGEMNARNAAAALVAAEHAGVSIDVAAAALASFRPVARRLQCHYWNQGIGLFEDYAHHPSAISATLAALREAFPGARIRAACEFTSPTARRAVFQREYSDAFREASRVLLLAPEPAWIDRGHSLLDLNVMCSELRAAGVDAGIFSEPDELHEELVADMSEGELIVLLSSGSFGGLLAQVQQALRARFGPER